MCCDVQFQEGIGALTGMPFGRPQRTTELTFQRVGRWQHQRLAEIPEQLVEVPHNRVHLEHLLGALCDLPPVLPTEGDLGDLMTCAEAVVDGATPKALLPQAVVNTAAEVRLQVGTGLSGGFVDREVCRGQDGRRDTAPIPWTLPAGPGPLPAAGRPRGERAHPGGQRTSRRTSHRALDDPGSRLPLLSLPRLSLPRLMIQRPC